MNIAKPTLAKPKAPSLNLGKPNPPKVNVPQTLPKIDASKASQVTEGYQPSAEAVKTLQPEMTPSQYVGALQQKNLSSDSIQFLANGMPDRESTLYACKSSRMVEDKLDPKDLEALKSAEEWVKNPSADKQAAAAKAAEAANFQGPGAWSAQAAAAAGQAKTAGVPAVTPQAASGAVQLAAAKSTGAEIPQVPEIPKFEQPEMAIPSDKLQPPEVPQLQQPEVPAEISPLEQAQVAEVQNPFVQLGVDIASGKITAV